MKTQSRSVFLILYGLLLLGITQVYSSSLILATEKFSDPYHFFYRQIIFCLVGLATFILVYRSPIDLVIKYSYWLWIIMCAALALTLVPGIGVKVGGAKRWIAFPMGFRFEPSEFLKLLLPLTIASLLPLWENPERIKFSRLFYLMLFVVPLLILLKQPDFGSFAILITVSVSLFFVLGLPWKIIAAMTTVSSIGFYFLVWTEPYRKARVMAFWDPWSNPQSAGFHTIQSLLSFQAGGLWGRGLGGGQAKLYFLPEAHTDYTLAIWGEEAGFIGFLLLMMAYAYLIHFGFRTTMKLQTNAHKIVAMGLTLVFCFSVFINVGVVLGLLPSKGLTLPFISYGGSSLVMFCALWGLLLNIHQQCRE